jgi:tetratricopeptide (TPR) repeat protein
MDVEVAAKLAPGNIVELLEMEQDMARRMLEMCLVDPKNEQMEVDFLLQGLAYLPLAIVQAAAYVNVNEISLQKYLPLLAEKKKGLVGVPNREFENVIAATWLISFEQILRHDTLAAAYLLFMACVDRNDIPLALLPTAKTHEQGVHAVRTLDAYSLVTKRTAESALDLHRLVHFSARSWLKKEGLMSQQTQAAITRLLEVFPDHNHGNRSKWRRLLPHATFALLSSPAEQNNEAKTKLVWKCAMTLYSDGRWKEAEELFVQVMETSKKKLGADHPDTLTSMANLASTLWNQGRWDAAEELEVQVMETRKKKLGADHPDTLTSMANLASTYRNQGRWDAAEELEVQVMETRKKKLGADHPDTLTIMNNLAFTWQGQGRDADAISLIREYVQLSQRILGSHHPNSKAALATLTQWEAEQAATDNVI